MDDHRQTQNRGAKEVTGVTECAETSINLTNFVEAAYLVETQCSTPSVTALGAARQLMELRKRAWTKTV